MLILALYSAGARFLTSPPADSPPGTLDPARAASDAVRGDYSRFEAYWPAESGGTHARPGPAEP